MFNHDGVDKFVFNRTIKVVKLNLPFMDSSVSLIRFNYAHALVGGGHLLCDMSGC